MRRSWWTACFSVLVISSLLLMSACSGGGNTVNSSGNNERSNAVDGESKDTAKNEKQVVIRHTMYDTEFTSELVAEFEKTHPNIKVEIVSADYNKLMAMMAAGNGPDIIRTNSVTELPGFVLKGMAMDLTENFQASKVFDMEDFLPVVNQFKYDLASGKHGEGAIYGFPKDWSPDYTIYYNKKLFEEAGCRSLAVQKR
ncbi:extracellular solute-binding protein [Paenibacillus sp. D2_2]|uniref:ABC transporter substrate-binding protein n=1 Tax=Paenibacillus sp. D2_2 TaxID=3073092 RepID=UPI00281683C8|nr:extracellular solute-binding protein [Paenibacillus sp. D2_2]WMT40093.1 extracellular solute-binding protein [Paenibacillus sp. D2_2]